MSLTLYGNLEVTPYSIWCFINGLKSEQKHLKSTYVKVLLITAMIPLAFVETVSMCTAKFSSLSIVMPESFSEQHLAIYVRLLSQRFRERERIYLPHIITTITTSTIVNITEAGCQRGTYIWCLSMLAACTNSNTIFFRKQIENKIKIQINHDKIHINHCIIAIRCAVSVAQRHYFAFQRIE